LTSFDLTEDNLVRKCSCACHRAHNNTLKFTAPDLSAIAQSLDQLEAEHNHDRIGRSSGNMDDTGFFSVQVLENALDAFGLK
jgi:hypothetical protein